MNLRSRVFFLFLMIFLNVRSQNTYYIQFSSKNISLCNVNLSKESIERKQYYKIPIDSKDYSIEKYKIDSIINYCNSYKISNWLNSMAVESTEEQIDKIKSFNFVETVFILKNKENKIHLKNSKETNYTVKDYGNSYNQIHIHNGESMHDSGYDGTGMKIAIFDGGFNDANHFNCFKHLFDNNKIHFGANLVYNSDTIFSYDGHGTAVLGCMASYIKDTITGTCPKADYYLFITEDVRSESKIEEFNWAVAAQRADSIGIDVINSSLGYSQFDDPSTNYTFSQMDGKTTIVSKAAKIAVDKGIIVVNSAGNEGNKAWKKITAPSDVEKVVTVGAIDNERNITNFSSRGWNAANIVKPDVVAVGGGASVFYNNGKFTYSNGTSFSSPIMAGLIACFWQKNKSFSSDSIRNLIYKSSHLFTNPNMDFGFGIPDFNKAIGLSSKYFIDIQNVNIFPNPTSNYLVVELYSKIEIQNATIDLYSLQGRELSKTFDIKKGINTNFIDVKGLAKGVYIVKIVIDKNEKNIVRKVEIF